MAKIQLTFLHYVLCEHQNLVLHNFDKNPDYNILYYRKKIFKNKYTYMMLKIQE